jgi:uncharacterized membrane protein YgcG
MNSRTAPTRQSLELLKRLLPLVALLACGGCLASGSAPESAAASKNLIAQQGTATSEKPNLCKGQKSLLPPPTGFVNDFAKVVDARTKQQLEDKLAALKKTSGIEFAVVTVETTGERDIFDYSIDVACGWGVGPALDRQGGGLLLLVAIKDRKWRVQVSRGLEADLPDYMVKEIGDIVVPSFRRGDYGAGILGCVDHYIARLVEREKVPRPAS